MFEDLKEMLKLAWKNDDLMMQEDLFELQELLAEATLKSAKTIKQRETLVKEFPWLYRVKEG